jgi:hypothetical protein
MVKLREVLGQPGPTLAHDTKTLNPKLSGQRKATHLPAWGVNAPARYPLVATRAKTAQRAALWLGGPIAKNGDSCNHFRILGLVRITPHESFLISAIPNAFALCR